MRSDSAHLRLKSTTRRTPVAPLQLRLQWRRRQTASCLRRRRTAPASFSASQTAAAGRCMQRLRRKSKRRQQERPCAARAERRSSEPRDTFRLRPRAALRPRACPERTRSCRGCWATEMARPSARAAAPPRAPMPLLSSLPAALERAGLLCCVPAVRLELAAHARPVRYAKLSLAALLVPWKTR